MAADPLILIWVLVMRNEYEEYKRVDLEIRRAAAHFRRANREAERVAREAEETYRRVYEEARRAANNASALHFGIGGKADKADAKLLGVPLPVTTVEALKSAWKEKAFAVHPDRGGSTDAAAKVNGAYQRMRERRGWGP